MKRWNLRELRMRRELRQESDRLHNEEMLRQFREEERDKASMSHEDYIKKYFPHPTQQMPTGSD